MVAKLQCAINTHWEDHNEYQPSSQYTKDEFLYIDKEILKEDPIELSFKNTRLARLVAKDQVEYANKFQIIVNENQRFAVTMLDLCKTQAEAELIMSNQADSDETSQFPRLELAISTNPPYTNIYCQEYFIQMSNK